MPLSEFYQEPDDLDFEIPGLGPKPPPMPAMPQMRTADMQGQDYAAQTPEMNVKATINDLMQPSNSRYGEQLASYLQTRGGPRAFETGMENYESAKVSPEEYKGQADRERLYALMGQLDKSANQVGTVGGKAAQSTLGDFTKNLAGAERGELDARQRLAGDAKKDAIDALGMSQKFDQFQNDQKSNRLKGAQAAYTMAKYEQEGQAKEAKSIKEQAQAAAAIQALKARGVKIPDGMSSKDALELYKMDQDAAIKRQELAAKGGDKPKDLSGDLKLKVAFINNAERNLAKMEDALTKGVNTFSVVGDNDFTSARKFFIEELGRLQSGGAIGGDEVENFKALLPTATDSSKMQKQKLSELRQKLQETGQILTQGTTSSNVFSGSGLSGGGGGGGAPKEPTRRVWKPGA